MNYYSIYLNGVLIAKNPDFQKIGAKRDDLIRALNLKHNGINYVNDNKDTLVESCHFEEH